MNEDHPKRLIVEAHDDVAAVTGLMRHYVKWDVPDLKYAVKIEIKNSADEILQKDYLSVKIKTSGLKALGVMLDADDKFDSRWRKIRQFCATRFSSVPKHLPAGGLVLEGDDGIRFGAWIMPDNKSRGMLENFCSTLVPAACKDAWDHAADAANVAQAEGAPWKEVHRSRAHIHTWLAWQDPPGERIHTYAPSSAEIVS